MKDYKITTLEHCVFFQEDNRLFVVLNPEDSESLGYMLHFMQKRTPLIIGIYTFSCRIQTPHILTMIFWKTCNVHF